MRLVIGIIIVATTLLAGCATGKSSISTVAPKFKGHPVQDMAMVFGAPERVSDVGSLRFYEWRIGQYATEPERFVGNVSDGGNVDLERKPERTQFLGCIIQAMVNYNDVVTSVTVQSKDGSIGNTHQYFSCFQAVHDPFKSSNN